jgi:hypothetical protein
VSRDHDVCAELLLGSTRDEACARSLRIAGIYALLYLEEPFLASWCGLAAFVALQVHRALCGPTFGYRAMMGEANVAIYRAIVPGFLRLRDGVPVPGALGVPFAWLVEADTVTRTDAVRGRQLVEAAAAEISRLEQIEVAQPIFAKLSYLQRKAMRELFLFRLGFDSAAPVIRFPFPNPADLDQRLRFTREHVLPAWNAAERDSAEWLRADCDRLRRLAGVGEGDLPRRP